VKTPRRIVLSAAIAVSSAIALITTFITDAGATLTVNQSGPATLISISHNLTEICAELGV
jgi:hypothetical protein